MGYSGSFPFALAMLVAVTAVPPVRADNIGADLETAQGLFNSQRQAPAVLEQVIASMRDAAVRADDATQKYAAYLLLSQAIYFKGMHLPESDSSGRKTTFLQGLDACQQGINVAKASLGDQRAECYYYKSINLGRWGEANGTYSPGTIARRHEYRRGVIDAMNFRRAEGSDDALVGANGQPVLRHTADGASGVSYEGNGPYRAMARMYFKLPPMFGRDLPRSETMLRDCVRLAPRFASNHTYLAETLWEEDKQDEARDVLRRLLANDEATFNPDRVAETHDEFNDARRLLRSYGG